MDILALLLGLLIGLVAGAVGGGFAVAKLVRSRASEGGAPAVDPAVLAAQHQAELAEVRAAEAAVQAEIRADLAAAHGRVDALQEQLLAAQQQYRETIERHRAEAEARAERERAESKVLQALAPVKETLQTMQQKVGDMEAQRSEQLGSLTTLMKQAQLADEQLRATTESLASALRSNSVRGVWGETQLQRVVEAAGLTQHVDFVTQTSIRSDAGVGRPDMIVRLPGGKYLPIDAKVPFDAYLEASQIPFTATGDEATRRKQLLDRHVRAIRGHIDALAKRTYWEGLDSSPEFVIAFIPSESLLSSALEADPALLDHAFGKRVALASPVNLWAVLKTVAYTWQQQAVTDEAKKLFDLGNLLYQRLGTLSGHAEGLRKAIERTVDSYNKFANSLETRVLVTARQFPGIDETKILAESTVIHETPRKLTALELDATADDEPRDMHGIDKLAIEERERAHAADAERDEPGVA
jgi:DNA recombination protein RmuC